MDVQLENMDLDREIRFTKMKVALITRATLYSVQGGDTFQVKQTARHLQQLGIDADIRLTDEEIDYDSYDLLHFFNIIRPADILCHIRKSAKPFAVSTLLVDYSGYDKRHRKGLSGFVCRLLPPNGIEYLKTIGRYLMGKDKLMSMNYLWKGHERSIREILGGASLLFANSTLESQRLEELYSFKTDCMAVHNGLDADLFAYDERQPKDEQLVLCVARIEGIKNQLNLIKALNNTRYRLLLIGNAAPGQLEYYRECRRIAAPNVEFIDQMPQAELVQYYQKAKVHILPSWFENCGLSSLEAGAMGCNIVITDKGYTREYYEDYAFYCDPGSPPSIFKAVNKAALAGPCVALRNKILTNYTWRQAAISIAGEYEKIVHKV